MSVQSVCRWLRSKSYGDLAEYFEDENIDAEAVERLTKSADGGFAILRAICGIGVKANRLMKLMEDLKKQVYIYLALTLQRNKPLLESQKQESTSDQHSTLGIPNSQLTISMGTTTQHQEHLRKQQEEEEDAKKQQEEANTVDDDDENIANTNTMMENFQKAISHRSPSLLGVSSIKIKSFITSAAMLGSYSIVKMRCLKSSVVGDFNFENYVLQNTDTESIILNLRSQSVVLPGQYWITPNERFPSLSITALLYDIIPRDDSRSRLVRSVSQSPSEAASVKRNRRSTGRDSFPAKVNLRDQGHCLISKIT
ncbi:hypothetical protein EMCRGX_G003826 [Ephydatia muelleri]